MSTPRAGEARKHKVERIRGVAQSLLFRNASWMTIGLALRVLLQAGYFVIVARTLGPEQFGVFSGTFALVIVLSPFATWGSGSLLVRSVSRDGSSFSEYWGTALSTTFLLGSALAVVACLLGRVVLPAEQAWTITFTLALGELLGTRISDISAQAFQAFQRLSYSSAILTIHSGYRLVLAAFLLFGPVQKTAASWALLHMIGGFLAAFTGSMLVTKRLGRPRLGLGAMRRDWLEGFYYSTSASAEGAYNDLDKPLLLRLGGQTAAGAYSAAYRVMDAAFIPARALISASFPRFFQRGAYGIRESISLAGRLIPWVAGLGAVGGLGLVAFKSLVPFLLGDGYAEAGVIALWLAPIPLLRALHFMAANCLAGAGFQGLRTAVQLGVVLVNVGLCFLLIPRFGWLGAAWSSLISDGLLAGTLWICVGLKAHVAWAVVR